MVRVSRGALRENIASILRGATDIVIDVRRDACGHGADLVAGVAHELGIRIFAEGDDPHGAPRSPRSTRCTVSPAAVSRR